MRESMPSRTMESVAAALDLLGVATRNPQGGDMSGTLTLVGQRLILRVDCVGQAVLYDPSEGTLNHRVPRATFPVVFRRGWAPVLAREVAAWLAEPRAPEPAPAAAPPPEPDPEPTPPAATEAPDLDRRILELCAQGRSQASIRKAVDVAHTTVRRVVEGRQPRGKGADRTFDPYKPELDPVRREMLAQRDAAHLPDDEMVAALRERLGDPPWQPEPRKPPVPVDGPTAVRCVELWGEGTSFAEIGRQLGVHSRSAQYVVEGQYAHGKPVVQFRHLDPHRRAALDARRAHGIPDTNTALVLAARFAPTGGGDTAQVPPARRRRSPRRD